MPAALPPLEPPQRPQQPGPYDPLVHDVLIVGGGLVGASLAIALDRAGLDVALLEAAPPGALPAVFDERNLSFSESTVNALTALGVLQKLRVPSGAIERIHISRRGDFGRTMLEASRHGRSEFGRVVVARDFGEALESRLAELPHLLRYRPVRFVGCDPVRDPGFREVRIADGGGERIIRTRLLVGADGTRSGVREALGIGADQHDYRQSLFVTRLRAERAPDGTAYERLGDHGPTALLPRGDRHYGLILAVAGEQSDAVDGLDEAGFLSHAQEAFGWRVGRFLSCGARSVYSATRVTSRELTTDRAVLVGNSAQTIHPVGAQGFNLGLRDALTLAELIHAGRAAPAGADVFDCGSAALLAQYRQRRHEDRQRTLQFSDGLARLSAQPSALMRPLRSLGLLALAQIDSVQSMLVGGALGYRGHVPGLCRTAVDARR